MVASKDKKDILLSTTGRALTDDNPNHREEFRILRPKASHADAEKKGNRNPCFTVDLSMTTEITGRPAGRPLT